MCRNWTLHCGTCLHCQSTLVLTSTLLHALQTWIALQDKCHPQTIEVCKTRADGLGLKVLVSDENDFDINKDTCGILLQYPATDGSIHDYKVPSQLSDARREHSLPPLRCLLGHPHRSALLMPNAENGFFEHVPFFAVTGCSPCADQPHAHDCCARHDVGRQPQRA